MRRFAGLPDDVTPHVLRHSFVSVGNDLQYTMATVAMIVGHSGNSTAWAYVHGSDPVLLAAADRISREIADRMGTPPAMEGARSNRPAVALLKP